MAMTQPQAFDEWMRMCKEEPDRFLSCMASARSHEKPSQEDANVSEYGRDCSTLLEGLMTHGEEYWNK